MVSTAQDDGFAAIPLDVFDEAGSGHCARHKGNGECRQGFQVRGVVVGSHAGLLSKVEVGWVGEKAPVLWSGGNGGDGIKAQ